MTDVGHHAQLGHAQIFIPKGNSDQPPADTMGQLHMFDSASGSGRRGCVHLVKAQGCTGHILPKPAKNCHDFPEQFCLLPLHQERHMDFYTSSSWLVLALPWTMLSQWV